MTQLFKKAFSKVMDVISSNPEFDDVIDALKKMSKNEREMIDGMSNAFGEPYDIFVKGQNPAISNSLQPIGQSMKKQIKAMNECFERISTLPDVLSPLKADHREFVKAHKDHFDLVEQHNKTVSDVAKAREFYEKQQTGSPYRLTAEESLKNAEAKEAEAKAALDKSLGTYSSALHEYEDKFIEQLTTILSTAAAERQKLAAEQRAIANDISESIKTIASYNDKTIPRLKQALKNLDYEVVD
ncbi:hypothetical protein TVAG_283080 [Trichomonas vaginalis G3]|uniref:BAR domain-containing protein n=1 Tax=Trichomonas vaginalis (strain ATCC PRA-98 / G3) TaxID=412133 RepID=A2DEL1_TRIV3|nr:arfaptin homology (AH) domain/bar domain domain-containing protein [Trichomonas vaginalis G3]EAY21138.1 hypothetical protein TVAG_283080 [Trichomonas vaginalis G3]KAI5522337.1 arfaptin homology (AH) domain/bar domain domain-containing protein [Trichomonas vaginalis G3]|eukprot:XP_001582124.1 hypothetical protein [Trichomonas vaginalis G3]